MHDDDARTASLGGTARATALAGALLIAGALLTLDPAFAAGTADIAPDFATLDADADGSLTEKEWMDSAPASMMDDAVAAAHFAMYDTDGNGSVSRDEYATLNERMLDGTDDEAI